MEKIRHTNSICLGTNGKCISSRNYFRMMEMKYFLTAVYVNKQSYHYAISYPNKILKILFSGPNCPDILFPELSNALPGIHRQILYIIIILSDVPEGRKE